jgi:hypothetical protein
VTLVVAPLLAGTAAPLTIAEQPAIAATMVVKEGMLMLEKVTDFELKI